VTNEKRLGPAWHLIVIIGFDTNNTQLVSPLFLTQSLTVIGQSEQAPQ
jgi:hypothetical protein